jgi:signal transduction histidine kinase
MAEMRRLFGVLRADGSPAALAPQPGLEQLDRLAEQMRASGLPLSVEVEGEWVALPPGVDLAAYRIVQESLTNVIRHAGSAPARVRLSFGDSDLEVTVEDDGPGLAAGIDSGHGLLGMRERVALYGGELETGSVNGRGFRVHARLPFREGA